MDERAGVARPLGAPDVEPVGGCVVQLRQAHKGGHLGEAAAGHDADWEEGRNRLQRRTHLAAHERALGVIHDGRQRACAGAGERRGAWKRAPSHAAPPRAVVVAEHHHRLARRRRLDVRPALERVGVALLRRREDSRLAACTAPPRACHSSAGTSSTDAPSHTPF